MTVELKQVAGALRDAFGVRPEVHRYYNDDESVWVDIAEAAGRPRSGVTSWGTIGMSRFDTDYDVEDGRQLRVELVCQLSSSVTTVGNMLTSCALNIADGEYGLEPDTIFPGIVGQWESGTTVPHMLMTDVSSFSGLSTLQSDDVVVAFLQAIPVSDAEFGLAQQSGVPALTDRLAAAGVDVLDLRRASAV